MENHVTKSLPLGRQHLSQFVEGNLIYVDKTPIIFRLVREGGAYFLSRPRRFGKSLLVDILKNIFLGNQHLFKGLWIYDKIEWKEHPVIHLDFSSVEYESLGLSNAIMKELDLIAKDYQVSLSSISPKGKLKELIENLSEKAPVALLIDEYDKPITDYITDLPKANENRETLREFYGALKSLGDKLRIIFITGIAKFARVSLFSVLNQLTDLTLKKNYASLCGITQEELIQYFGDYLYQIEQEQGHSHEKLLEQIKHKYNGYSWDGKTFVYNPFSLLHFLDEGQFRNFWFKTGTPAFLIELLRKQRMPGNKLKTYQVEDTFFDTFNIEQGIAIKPLLFQTGYSTIKNKEPRGTRIFYTLDYPQRRSGTCFYP